MSTTYRRVGDEFVLNATKTFHFERQCGAMVHRLCNA